MLESRRDTDLAVKTLRAQSRGHVATEHLDRNGPVMAHIPGAIDGRHAALADDVGDLVTRHSDD
ncbi:hypothetical protein D3C83_293270 [compost metagenome]